MTPDGVGVLSRPFPLGRVTAAGTEVVVNATGEERAALAADLGLPAIHRLEGRFRVSGNSDRVHVAGEVRAELDQVCVVSLDPFTAELTEDVAVDFQRADPRCPDASSVSVDLDGSDPPEELVGDRIDLGAVTAEFLALGLDPYPRKPGVTFEEPGPSQDTNSPFAELARLRRHDSEPS